MFRSQLEASWANTLTHLGIVWQYEPERVALDEERTYLPDFWLPDLTTMLEVKGAFVPGLDKAFAYARQVLGELLVVVGFNYYRPTPRVYRMTFAGAVERVGFARCVACDTWLWVSARTMACRACGADIPHASFYRQGEAPFWPALTDRTPDRDGASR